MSKRIERGLMHFLWIIVTNGMIGGLIIGGIFWVDGIWYGQYMFIGGLNCVVYYIMILKWYWMERQDAC